MRTGLIISLRKRRYRQFEAIMALRCDICGEVAACLLCECKTPPVSVCQRCFSEHMKENSEHTQVSPGVDATECTKDGNPAAHFCLCNSYVCSTCLPNHYPSRDKHQVFPMYLHPQYLKDNTGTLLKQGEILDRISAALQKQAKELKAKLTKKVKETFDTLYSLLTESRECALVQVNKYAEEFEQESLTLVHKLAAMKYEPAWQANTEFEAIILREDVQEIAELETCVADWVFEMEEFKQKWKSLSRCKNWKYLLGPVPQEPSYFAVANGKTQVFSLPSLQPIRVPTQLSTLKGSLLCLPSTEWFLCETTLCHRVAPDFSSKRTICSLKEPRKKAILAYYRNSVYLFGGHNGNFISSYVECVDLDSKSARTLACFLPVPFVHSVPCRYKNSLYFGQMFLYRSSFIFHLDTERLDLLELDIGYASSCIAIPFPNNEIVFLTNKGIFGFLIQDNYTYPIVEGSQITYKGNTVPVCYQGYWYFLGKNEDMPLLFTLEVSNKDLKSVGVYEKPDFS